MACRALNAQVRLPLHVTQALPDMPVKVDLGKSDFELFQAFWRTFAVKCLSLQDIDWSKVSLCEDAAASDWCFLFFACL